MATAVSATRKKGSKEYHASGTESGLGSGADEIEISGLPEYGTILAHRSYVAAGSNTTHRPRLGKSTGFSSDTDAHVSTLGTAPARNFDEHMVLRYHSSTGSLFLDLGLQDVATDHQVNWELLLIEGWLE